MNVNEAIRARKSIRSYKAEPVETVKLNAILEAIRSAPSAKNLQPFHVKIITSKELTARLPEVCHGQKFVAEAPVILCFYGDQSQAYPGMGEKFNSLEVDVAIAVDHATLQAVELGLGTCWIGAFSEDSVKSLLNIRDPNRVISLLTIGYPAKIGESRPRKTMEEIFEYLS
ncbi:MAG: nitroreductase family protein [Candidatus Wallbacteria bacterium]|nr:nitroreductase family protein [Candidatus Wallbacteria bacterium]